MNEQIKLVSGQKNRETISLSLPIQKYIREISQRLTNGKFLIYKIKQSENIQKLQNDYPNSVWFIIDNNNQLQLYNNQQSTSIYMLIYYSPEEVQSINQNGGLYYTKLNKYKEKLEKLI